MLRALFPAALLLALAIAPGARADHSYFLEASPATTRYGDDVTLTARLRDGNAACVGGPCGVPGVEVDFYVDGAYVGTDVTNSGGYAYLLLTSQASWHAGSHAVRVQFDRFSFPDPAVATTTLTVLSEVTVLAARDGYLEARLTDDDAAALEGFAIRFDKDGQELCTAFTDSAGAARCLPWTGAGATPLDAAAGGYTATFAGTGDFVASSDGAVLV